MNVEPYSSFAAVGSDHRIVTIKLSFSIRAPKAPQPKKRYDWKLLKHDDRLCSNFSIELRNKYLELYDENSSPTEQYDALVQAKDHAAATTLPLAPKERLIRHLKQPCNYQGQEEDQCPDQ